MMKKLLSLVLAVLLALSFGINAFAADLVVLYPRYMSAAPSKVVIPLVDAQSNAVVLYTTQRGVYYIALDDMPYRDITVTANGVLSAELVEFDPETMVVEGMDIIYGVSCDGEIVVDGLEYEEAVKYAKEYNAVNVTDSYSVVLLTNVNIIKITVDENYSTSYREGTLRVDATLNNVPVTSVMTVVLDVSIFEPKYVKAISDGFDEGRYLACGDLGYSDYMVDIFGYGEEYNPEEHRYYEDAAVVSTTTFKSIEGQNLAYACAGLVAELYNIAPGQKGVNFKHYAYETDYNWDGRLDSICFGFLGNQVVKSEFTVELQAGYDWYDLREAFGLRIEEDNVITYYLLKDGKLVKQYTVDYGIADTTEEVVLSYTGSNETLGMYELRIEAPITYSIEYDANGGENAPKQQGKTFGIDEYISEEIPTRKWHTFLGWATSPDATEPEYAPGDVYSVDKDVTFYAVWKEDVEAKADILISGGTASVGEKFHITVDLSSTVDISMMQFALKYDANLLEVVSFGTGIAGEAIVNCANAGIIYFLWEDTEILLKSGTVLDVEFSVKGGAEPQDTLIEIVEQTEIFEPIFVDSELNEFRVKTEKGTVNIIKVRYGDINGDGKINVIDANLVRRYSAKLTELNEEQSRAADVNGDGKINILDANLIRRYTVKLIDIFPVEEE